MGASPDSVVSCPCCREGLLEIKCLFSIWEQDPTTVTAGVFYLKVIIDRCLQFSKEHNYYMYYQIQRLTWSVQSLLLWLHWTLHGVRTNWISCARRVYLAPNAAQVTSIHRRSLTANQRTQATRGTFLPTEPKVMCTAFATRGSKGEW